MPRKSDPLYTQLQKFFRLVKAQTAAWKTVVNSVSSSFESIRNISEQLSSISQVTQSTCVLLQEFPDLKDKLEVNILQSLEKYLLNIRTALESLHKIQKQIAKESDAVETIQVSLCLSADETSRALATIPSLAELLQWTQDLHWIFFEEYEIRNNVLETVCYTDLDSVANLEKHWFDVSHIDKRVDQVMVFLTFFLDDDFIESWSDF